MRKKDRDRTLEAVEKAVQKVCEHIADDNTDIYMDEIEAAARLVSALADLRDTDY